MKKRFFALLFAVVSAVSCAFAFTACTSGGGNVGNGNNGGNGGNVGNTDNGENGGGGNSSGEQVTAEQWRQAFDLSTCDHYSVLTIRREYSFDDGKLLYSSWNKFSFDGDKVGNVWGDYDDSLKDPYKVTGELIEVKDGGNYFHYAKSDNEWTKEESTKNLFDMTVQNCRSSIAFPDRRFDLYEFDGNGGKYVLREDPINPTRGATVIIKGGKLSVIEHTVPPDFDNAYPANTNYSLTFDYNAKITLLSV